MINKVCASGMQAVALAKTIIRAKDADVIIAGGMESMSNAPFALKRLVLDIAWEMTVLDLLINDGGDAILQLLCLQVRLITNIV